MSTMQVGGVEFDITVDASGVATAKTRAVDDLAKLQKAFGDTDTSAKKTTRALSRVGKNAGQAGIQIQQFVGQVQGGQSVMLALSQQAADLGFVLGVPLGGAVAGLSASLLSTLIPSLFSTGDATDDLIEKLEDLAKTQLLTKEQAAFLASQEGKMISEREKTISSLEEEIKERRDLIKARQAELDGDMTAELMQRQSRYLTEIKEASEYILEQEANLSLLNQQQEEAKDKLEAYNLAVDGGNRLTDEQAESIEAAKESLRAQIIALEDGAKAAEIYAAKQKAIKDGTQAELPAIIELINKKYAAKAAQEAETKAVRDQIQAQKELDSVLGQIFKNDEEDKKQTGNDLEALRESLMSEEQLRAQSFINQGELLKEARELELLTDEEYDALDKERRNQHLQWILDKEEDAAKKREQIEKQAQDAMNSLRQSAINNAIGLLDQFAGESKAAALASIALSKGLAIAQAIQNTGVAVMKANAVDPSGILAAKMSAVGAANVAMIAATGLAQGASALSGSSSSQTYSGGVPATNTTGSNSNATTTTRRVVDLNFTGNAPTNARELVEILNEAAGDNVQFNFGG